MTPNYSNFNVRLTVGLFSKAKIWIFVTIAVLSLFLPLAFMFEWKTSSPTPESSIIVPLYIYPSKGAWDPLFKANGPGHELIPDANYTREIPRLNSFPNVRTVGYISTNWTNRHLDLVLKDVDIYSNWSQESMVSGLGVRGIFLDETPTRYNKTSARFLGKLASVIRSEKKFGQDALIIHNPGAIPDIHYMSYCSIVVIFEQSYLTYQRDGLSAAVTAFQKSSNLGRQAIACIIHSLPNTLTSNNVKSLIQDLRQFSNHIFLTGLSLDYYAQFWEAWPSFVAEF